MSKKKTKKKKVKIWTPEEQMDALKARYGHNSNWVEVNLPLTYGEVTSYFGPECKDYEPTCGCCRAWVEWHTKSQKVTVTLERHQIIKALLE